MRHLLKYSLLFVLLCALAACSTRKSTFFTRAFHNTTTHYNWYFNGNEAVKSGEKKLMERHQDDYNQILSVYPLGTEKDAQSVAPSMDKAIKKGAKAISKHSIYIKGEEHNRWIDDCYLMIAKAYFYKREYVKAIEALRYISRQYQGSEKDFEAAVWLSRCYIDNKDYTSADMLFNMLLADESFPESLNQPLSLAYAHYFIQIKDYPSAIEELQQAVELTSNNRFKMRYTFVLAQLYHHEKNYSKATYYYDQVLRKSPDYEMAFNAKINKARAFDVESGDTQAMRDELQKMLKDDKNKEYLDVIYFALAELSMRESKIEEAIPLYRISTAKSISNDAQKALSSLSVGKLYYEKQNYRLAQAYYDTAIAYSNINTSSYKQTLQRQQTLTNLIENLDIIEVQDSLQMVAVMSEADRTMFIDEIIAKIKEEERLQLEMERNNRMENAFFNDGQNRMNNRFNRHNQNNGGTWYFYNPTTLSFGYSEFNRKWGKRKLEDNWRRATKTTLTVSELEADTIQEEVFDPKSRDSYLKNLPLTVEAMQASNQQIIEAYYNAGVIYKEGLKDIPQSVKMFENLNRRFPQNVNRSKVLYHLYRLYEGDNATKSEEFKNKLLKEYPESEYAKLIGDPAYLEKVLDLKSEVETLYQQAHNLYLKGEYSKSILVSEKALKDHPENLLLPRFNFLIALATGFVDGKEELIFLLKKVIEDHQEHEVSESAKEILAHLLFGGEPSKEELVKKDVKEEDSNDSSVEYSYKENTSHYFVIIFKDFDIPLDMAKAIFSDYHAEFYSLRRLNISSILIDEQTHMISIREFGDANASIDYYKAFLESEAKGPFANDFTAFTIAAPNFPNFFKNKDIEGYKKYFKEIYLEEE